MEPAKEIGEALALSEQWVDTANEELAALLEEVPALKPEIGAMLTLAQTGEAWVTPIIAVTSATGTLLRRKLEPVVNPVLQQYAVLRKSGATPAGTTSRRRGLPK